MGYDAKALRLARRGAQEKTEEFRQVYRFCAGVEGTMSDLDRMTGLKHLRVRGMPQVRLAAVLKATGLNILRSVALRNCLRRHQKGELRPYTSENRLVGTVKERLLRMYDVFQVNIFAVVNFSRRVSLSVPIIEW